ncbi:MAG: hypothetical protein Q9227_001095 [Pyrenula ochraceoflavens]
MLFGQNQATQVANDINRYLRWWDVPVGSNNLFSWTSSLLFALQYIIWRHKFADQVSKLDEIELCIIDTSDRHAFPEGAFIRDIHLVNAYKEFDNVSRYGLEGFANLRSEKYYFSEYLSQGALIIKNNCKIVSAPYIFGDALSILRPEFDLSTEQKKELADKVVRMRQELCSNTSNIPQFTDKVTDAAIKIGRRFGGQWMLPVVANLIAITPGRIDDEIVLELFRIHFTDDQRRECDPSKTKLSSHPYMPEVNRFNEIMQKIYTDYYLKQLKANTIMAEQALKNDLCNHVEVGSGNSELLENDRVATIERLDAIISLAGRLKTEVYGGGSQEPAITSRPITLTRSSRHK